MMQQNWFVNGNSKSTKCAMLQFKIEHDKTRHSMNLAEVLKNGTICIKNCIPVHSHHASYNQPGPAIINKDVHNSLNYSLDDSVTWTIVLFDRALQLASVTSHPYCCLLEEHEHSMYKGAFQADNDHLSHRFCF